MYTTAARDGTTIAFDREDNGDALGTGGNHA